MNDIFARNTDGMTERLSRAVIGIAGCGGIGSNAAVSLVRAGIGKIIIADFDIVEASNLNRQNYFTQDIGKVKVSALKEILLQINPDCVVEAVEKEVGRNDIAEIFGEADIMIEAFDKAESKEWLIEEWATLFPEKPVISGNGLSGFGDFASLKVKRADNIWFCGDGTTSSESGLCSARVAIVSNMQANLAIELLMNNKEC